MKKILVLGLFVLLGHFARAQVVPAQTIKAANGCAQVDTGGLATMGMQLTGTWSATLQPEVAISGQAAVHAQVTPSTSTSPQSTITSNGVYTASVAGYDTFMLCATAYTSGTATVWFRPSDKVNAGLLGNGGGGSFSAGGDLSGTSSNQTVIGLDTVPFCTGFTPTNGQALEYSTGLSPNPCYTAITPVGAVSSVSGTNGVVVSPTTGAVSASLGGALQSYPNAVTVSGTNNIYTGADMFAAIEAAIAANGSGHVYNAQGFTGNQVVLQTNAYGNTAIALYGGAAIGTEVDGTLLLSSSLNLYVDGVAGNFTDGVSNFGTPAIIVPWGFKIEYSSPIGHFVLPCTGTNTPVTGCTHAFPVRSFSVSATSVTGNTLTATTSGIVNSGGPAGNQNMYVKELAALTSPSCVSNNLLRTIQSIPGSTSFTISVPSTTANCASTGTLYLVTPMFGFGLQNSGTGYEPITAGQQAFGTKLINVNVDLSSVLGLVGIQNLNQGEQSEVNGYYCRHPAMGCLQVGGGANDTSFYDNLYMQTLSVTTNVNPTTFGIFNAAAGGGFRRFTGNIAASLNGTAFEPNACVYNDGNAVAFTGEFHCEGPVDLFETGMDNNVGAMHVSVSLSAPSSNPNVNQVHVVNDGYTVSGSIFEMVGTQPSGGTNAVKDDQNSVTVTDSALTMYTLTNNGTQVWIGGNGNITAAGGLNGNNLNISGTNCSSVSLPLSAGQGCLAAGSTQGTFVPTRVNTGASAAAIAEVQVGDCASPTTITGSATTATIAYSDSVGCTVRHDFAGSASATITIPVPTGGTSLNNAHPFFTYCNDSAHADTLTPTTFTIRLNGSAAAASQTAAAQTCYKVNLDPTNANVWTMNGPTAGSSVSVNGSSVASPNFNGSTPAAGTGNQNVTWQSSGSSVSAEIPLPSFTATINAIGSGGSTQNINCNNGAIQTITLSANLTISFTQPGTSCIVRLHITQASGGNDTVTWTSVKWPGGIAPVMTATASASDWYSCMLDGTNTWCTAGQNFQ